jgi:hypothetical protein
MSDFEVVVMTNAPKPQIEFFYRKYVELGAAKITIYIDGPGPLTIDGPIADVTICDDDFWRRRGCARPRVVEDRQREVYTHAYEKTESRWILFVDIDEFVCFPSNLNAVLEQCPHYIRAIRFPTIEAVYAHDQRDLNREFGARLFRKPYNKYLAFILPHIVYPGLGSVFIRGLLGHAVGKQIFRAKVPRIEIKIHHAELDGDSLGSYTTSTFYEGGDICLSHFHAISLSDWRRKWIRRIAHADTKEMGRKGERQLNLFLKYNERSREERLFRRMYVLNPVQLRILKAFNQVVERPNGF